jgi:hypothetical protein
MDIERVNIVLAQAIMGIQTEEIEALIEAAFVVPSPEQMHQKHGMPLPAGMAQDELIGKGMARVGMIIGTWKVVKADARKVTLATASGIDPGSRFRGKAYTWTWDGVGYQRGGASYLHADGSHELAGSKEPDFKKIYPPDTVVTSESKWTFIITGSPDKTLGWKGKFEGYKYPARKLKGKKAFTLTLQTGGSARFDGGGQDYNSLYRVKVRPPR